MGNNCVGSRNSKDGLFPYIILRSFWLSQSTNPISNVISPMKDMKHENDKESKLSSEDQVNHIKEVVREEEFAKPKPKMLQTVKRVKTEGLKADSVLLTKSGNLKEYYNLGVELGKGQYGITSLCIEKATGKKYACKSIAKVKFLVDDDVEDVRREIQIMHHLVGSPNVISIEDAYEDSVAVHVVMELCAGGELFDRIVEKGHYTERKAAKLAKTIVSVVEACHSLGVMHRDLKPENFLFVDEKEDSTLKAIDFGMSVFFKPGDVFTDMVGSPYYIAPEVLCKNYGPEADVWSAGVIIYILLCGTPPFWGESEHEIFEEVLDGDLDFSSDPWPTISESAKDLIRKMLVKDPRNRITAHEVLCHPWIQVDGVAPDKPIDSAVLSRLKQFSATNKLKKMALRIIAENLSEEEISGLKEMFKMIDTDNSGQITFEKLKIGVKTFGANLTESEIYDLMQMTHIQWTGHLLNNTSYGFGLMILQADVDNSGTIDYGEFLAATLHLNKVDRENHLVIAFSYFDKDGSGYITQDELQQAYYNEFVAMMQRGNEDLSKSDQKGTTNFGIGFREALSVC
ncbi:putative protein kinase CAMK-CDPK family [Lupinus albus]|uniref:non-specific serine/threonine protein kinase n=1 Tax=Lupinus albus TaxID=3870 RepID=A0A6A4NTU7_LUPAL|nr:putative protein kinase CAMK-CDPK family [Lupinus albus]